jgi:Fe-S cluster biogenesis protein NfuA
MLRNLWGVNGDFISIQYAGTCSTITEVTKTSKQSLSGRLAHGMVTVTRFYKNTLSSKEELR